MFMCLLCALIVSVIIASTIFAVAIAFLVLSIVCPIVVVAEIVGLESPNAHPLPVVVPGGRCGWQRCRAAPLDI